MITVNTDAWQVLPITKQEETALKSADVHPGQLTFITTFSIDGWDNSQEWQKITIEFLADAIERCDRGKKLGKTLAWC